MWWHARHALSLSAFVHAREFYVHSTGGLARHGADVMSCEAIIANHHDVSPVMISVQSSTSTATPKDERMQPSPFPWSECEFANPI